MQTETSLSTKLAANKAGFASRVAPERVAMMEGATAKLKETGIEFCAKKAGDNAPSVNLPSAKGDMVSLECLWKKGSVVAIFYRGGWCPYCNLELRAWQKQLPELTSLGATLVAISPQIPDNSLSTAEKNELAFPVLSDSSMVAADGRASGLAGEPGRAAPSTTGRVWAFVFAFAARCDRADGRPGIG